MPSHASVVRRAVPCPPAGGLRTARLICLGALIGLLAWCPQSQAAGAAALLGYSATRSGTEPYAACPPPTADRAQCTAIVDPTSALQAQFAAVTRPAGATPASGVSPACQIGEYSEFCGSGPERGFTPQDLESAYRLPSSTAGSGQTVAIVDAYDDPNAQADLDVYRSTYDLPPCESGCFSKVNQTGGTTYPEASSEWSLEISIDLDMVSAACPLCHILLVEATNHEPENLGIAENEAATLGATEISNSYFIRELELGKAKIEEYSKSYKHPGIPITAASGDDGYDDEVQCKLTEGKCPYLAPSFPADLATVVAVGGTHLEHEGETGRGWHEGVWPYTGSGCTLYTAKPAWQSDKGCAERTDNDVAAVAGTESPVSVYDTYSQVLPGWQDVGGTSVATPLVAGAIALESSALRAEGSEGIYKHTGNWFDVENGTNWFHLHEDPCEEKYLCNGGVGYNGPTGVGTPDGGATATPPSAVTESATSVTTTGATLNAVVNPEESSEATYYFQYGETTSYGKEAPAGGATVTGYTRASYVSQAVSGLRSETLYHYRVVAKSSGGTTYGADRTLSTAPKVYLSRFGSKGTTEGKFEGPQWTAVNGYGDVWVTDYANNRVEEFSPSGEFIRACGSTGSGKGEFKGPTGIAIDLANGELYVADSGNDRIVILSQGCEFSKEPLGKPGSENGELSDPMGLAFRESLKNEGTPELLVADAGNDRIDEFEPLNGEFLASYGSKGSGEGQYLDPTDIILAGVESKNVVNFDVVDSGNDRVQELSGTIEKSKIVLAFLRQFGSKGAEAGELSSPTAIALDPTTGDLLVTDTGNDRVEEFLPNGTYVAQFGAKGSAGEGFESPRGIAIGSSGDVDIADYSNERIDIWQPAQGTYPEWHLSSTPVPSGAIDSYFYGASCPSATACTAVGESSTNGNTTDSPLAESFDGNEWSLQSAATPTGAKRTSLYGGVSCASATACTAVGYYESTASVYFALIESWNGTEWKIQSTPEPTGTRDSLLARVSCTSSTACTAVGWYENSSGVELPWADRWNGTEWSLQSAPAPTGAKASYPYGVSCVSSTACTLVGYYLNSSSAHVLFAEGWNGTEWKTQSPPAPSGAKSSALRSVSCPSATVCIASGSYENSAGGYVSLAEGWNGTQWSIQTTPDPAGAKQSPLNGVSCATTEACTAVGDYESSSDVYWSLVEHWNGIEWLIQTTPSGEHEGSILEAVSCPSRTACAAVGDVPSSIFAEIYH
jgi:DNA-binding beta-propeller fold protein YncE